jgi:hypothetical protein
MEYRGVEYTLEEDGFGGWQWAVVLGSPPTIKSGHAPTRGIAILKVWAAIGCSVREGLGWCNRNDPRRDFGQERFSVS